jgi:hypothetical protein
MAERVRTVSSWPAVYYITAAIPVAALAAGWRGTRTLASAHVVFAVTLVLLSELVLLRDEPAARLPDVCATTAIVMAIIIGRRPPAVLDRAAPFVLVGIPILVIAGAFVAGQSPVTRWRLVTDRLREARAEITPVPGREPLVRFLQRCTAPADRLFIGGFAPELPVLAHRAFAGGLPDWVHGYYTDAADIARARAQLAREHVAAAVMIDGGESFTREWPAIAADLQAQGLRRFSIPLRSESIEVWLKPSATTDRETGLPCSPSVGGSEDPPLQQRN